MKISTNAGRTLGQLENDVMEIVWNAKEALSVGNVVKVLNKKKPIAYTTVMTIMGRLTQKGILIRNAKGAIYLYTPTLSRKNFVAKSVHKIFTTAVSTLGKEAVAYFANEVQKVSSQKRKELLKILGKNNE